MTELHKRRGQLQPFLENICSMLQSDPLHQALVDLDLIEKQSDPENDSSSTKNDSSIESSELYKVNKSFINLAYLRLIYCLCSLTVN